MMTVYLMYTNNMDCYWFEMFLPLSSIFHIFAHSHELETNDGNHNKKAKFPNFVHNNDKNNV